MLGAILGMPVGTALIIVLIVFFFGGTILTTILKGIGMGCKALVNVIFHK